MDKRRFRPRTADLEMFEMNKTGKGSNESWDIRGGVEERWVLVGEEFCDVLVAVFCLSCIGDVRLWRICEVDLLPSFWMDQRWQRTLSSMWDAEGQVLHVMSNSIKSGEPGRSCQDTGSEGDLQVFEQVWSSTRAEIVADKS
jgi:hypothetical protein